MLAPELAHIRAAARLALQSWRARGDTGAGQAGSAPRRRVAVEREDIRIDPRRVAGYLAATGGSGLGGSESPVPPIYPALWETAMALELLVQSGASFPSGGLIHLGGEAVQLRPMRPGDRIRCRLEVDRVEEEAGGVRLTLVGRNWNVAGQLCLENTMRLLLRGGVAGGRGRSSDERAAGAEEPAWTEVERWSLGRGHGRRYARISGDFNPIHLWGWSARLFGFASPILHGYCTQAMVAHALIRRHLGGNMEALRRLEIAFRAPLDLPADARLLAARREGGGRFRVMAGEESRRPIAEGEWVG